MNKNITLAVFLSLILLAAILSLLLLHTDPGESLFSDAVRSGVEEYVRETADTTEAVTEALSFTDTITPPPTSIPLSDAPSSPFYPTVCEQIPLDKDQIQHILQQTVCADTAMAIVRTVSGQYHLALCGDDGYSSVGLLSENPLFSWEQTTISPFTDIFGHSGAVVTVPVGANAAERKYIALDGEEPLLLAVTVKGTTEKDGILVEQYTMGGVLNLYRKEGDAVVCYDLASLFRAVFADAEQVYAYYRNNLFYETHHGLFIIQVQDKGENGFGDNYTAWLDGDSITLLHWNEMKLPEETASDQEDTYRTDEAARAWIISVMETDFVLQSPVDPTTLTAEALQNHMDAAYRAGTGVLALYEIASERMYGGEVLSGNDPAYFCAGEWYYDMKNPAFPTFAAWEHYIRQILSNDLADALTARHDRFISVNGGLWGVSGARGSDITMQFAGAEVTAVSDHEIVYTVSVDILDPENDWAVTDTQTHDFVYSKTEDGWRWTILYVYN